MASNPRPADLTAQGHTSSYAKLEELFRHAINCESAENESNTPDFVLAIFLARCLEAFNHATNRRAEYFGQSTAPSRGQGADCPWCTAPVPMDDPFRPLGERLAHLLDSDHWNNVEPMLNDLRRRFSPAPVASPERFKCPECGVGAKADEDGCCAACGADCEIVAAPAEPETGWLTMTGTQALGPLDGPDGWRDHADDWRAEATAQRRRASEEYTKARYYEREFLRMQDEEAACCPEDVGFTEWIATLTNQRDQARSALSAATERAEAAERERDEWRDEAELKRAALRGASCKAAAALKLAGEAVDTALRRCWCVDTDKRCENCASFWYRLAALTSKGPTDG